MGILIFQENFQVQNSIKTTYDNEKHIEKTLYKPSYAL